MAIEISLINENEALTHWANSSHGSVFNHPKILGVLSQVVDWWAAKKGKQTQAIWPVCKPNGSDVDLPDLTYYVGPLWSNEVYPLPGHRSLARTTEVYNGFIEKLIENYGSIVASLPKGLHDVRVFDWWNYHQKSKPRFQIRPRFTACIEGLQEKSEEQILADFRQLRRRELRSIEKETTPPQRSFHWTADDLTNLYLEVVDDQTEEIKKANLNQIPSLVKLVNHGYGEVVAYQDPVSQRTIAACLLLYGNHEANMVLNLVDNQWRGTGLSALMIKEAILSAKSKGMSTFDFNGANSPNRGDDKHSYGAKPVLYFEIKYPG
jgi:lipid II:glycine glycyltransferase (peptidoglycan interpeptide bridge formation enzyme)